MPILQKTPLPVTASDFAPIGRHVAHVCKVKPNSVVVYKKFVGFSHAKTEAELANLKKGKNGDYNGFMSPATARKVRTLLENWLLALEQEITDDWQTDTKTAFANPKGAEYYPTFVTLTLPATQMHSDNDIKRNLLNRFIINLKSLHGVRQYFWRAEPQKNGNIHFHILVDKWIHWRAIRHDWNKILDEYGYIEAYRKAQTERHKNGYREDVKEMRSRFSKLREFAESTGKTFDDACAVARVKASSQAAYDHGVATNWSDPNSTDIHAIEKVESLTAYVVKYVTKTDGADVVRGISQDGETEELTTRSRKINGRIWGCSDQLRELRHFEAEVAHEEDFHTFTHDTPAFDFVCALQREAESKKLLDPDDESMWQDEDSGTTVFRLDRKSHVLLKSLYPALFADYSRHYQRIYADCYDKVRPKNSILELVCSIPEIRHSFTSADKPPAMYNYESLNSFATDYKAGLSDFAPVMSDCPF